MISKFLLDNSLILNVIQSLHCIVSSFLKWNDSKIQIAEGLFYLSKFLAVELLEPLTLPMHFSEISNDESSTYQIFLSNQVEQLDKLSNWLSTLVGYLNISSQTAFRIDLILSEAITNIIENAYDDRQTHLIKVELRYFNSKATLYVEDDGVPFNPLERPEVELLDKLEDTKIGGLGIHLIRRYSDECNYQRKNHRNRLVVVVCDVPKEK